ncbi:hypothetical protein J4P41_14845 [Gluconobacter sp. NFX36]|uniref:hypothetical protein n=1 Tax=Gluconobacter sp. NFX36 TaxID=2819535 RepID=UPI003CEC6F03
MTSSKYLDLFRYSEMEHEKILSAEEDYGNSFINCYNSTIALSDLVYVPTKSLHLFFTFYSQLKKYHSLAMFSAVRLHSVQSMQNLRYFLESLSNSLYILSSNDYDNYFDFEKRKVVDSKKSSIKCYRWIESEYPEYSKFIKDLKDEINENHAHSNILNSDNTLQLSNDFIYTPFFDLDDKKAIKKNLWIIAKSGIFASEMILNIRERFGGFIPKVSLERIEELKKDNDEVLRELQKMEFRREYIQPDY